ncbi:MAG: antibiotic biosynthesis monooxygenase [Lentisphaerota bacterium]
MHVTLVHIHVKPDKVEDFLRATQANHQGSIREPGNRRFDVLQSPDDPCYFLLYESYLSKEDVAAHKTTAHYLTWRDSVTDWMAETRKAVVFNGLLPAS